MALRNMVEARTSPPLSETSGVMATWTGGYRTSFLAVLIWEPTRKLKDPMLGVDRFLFLDTPSTISAFSQRTAKLVVYQHPYLQKPYLEMLTRWGRQVNYCKRWAAQLDARICRIFFVTLGPVLFADIDRARVDAHVVRLKHFCWFA